MSSKVKIEVWALIDENGDYVVCSAAELLAERYEEEIGGDAGMARRCVKVMLDVSLPAHKTLVGVVPDDDETAELTVA